MGIQNCSRSITTKSNSTRSGRNGKCPTKMDTPPKTSNYSKMLSIMHKMDNTRLPLDPRTINWDEYEKRVAKYENDGMTRSDAQGIVDMEMENERNEQPK